MKANTQQPHISFYGKDYLSLKEAATYACVSDRQFRDKSEEYGIHPVKFMGKIVYRKADIQCAIELVWKYNAA